MMKDRLLFGGHQAGFIKRLCSVVVMLLFVLLLVPSGAIAANANKGYVIVSPAHIDATLNFAFVSPLKGESVLEFDVSPSSAQAGGTIVLNPFDRKARIVSAVSAISLKDGEFYVKDGEDYISTGVSYKNGKTYSFKINYNIPAATYAVSIDGKVASATSLGFDTAINKSFTGDYEGIVYPNAAINNIGQFMVYNTGVESFEISNISVALKGLVDNGKNLGEQYNPEKNGDGSKTFYVGPDHKFKKVQDVLSLINEGDTIILKGNCQYPAPIIISKGVKLIGEKVNGKIPEVISAAVDNMIDLSGKFKTYQVENIKITGNLEDQLEFMGYSRKLDLNVFPGDDGIVPGVTTVNDNGHSLIATGSQAINYRGVRPGEGVNLVIRGCEVSGTYQGLLGSNMGNITIDKCDFHNNGTDAYGHNIYLASNDPNVVANVTNNVIHDTNSDSNGLKSRFPRTNVYYNKFYNNSQAFELIGSSGAEARAPRRDGDIVGNLIISSGDSWAHCRVGHDGTGVATYGRFRFANNTFVTTKKDHEVLGIRLYKGVESIEAYNNVFYVPEGQEYVVLYEAGEDYKNGVPGSENVNWASGKRMVYGANNWISNGDDVYLDPTTRDEWVNTVYGDDPGFVNLAKGDYTPKFSSPLVGAGIAMSETVHNWPVWVNGDLSYIDTKFPKPLLTLKGRVDYKKPTIGAFEAQSLPTSVQNQNNVAPR